MLGASVLLGGFINLIPPIGGTYAATLITDGVLALMAVAILARIVSRRGRVAVPPWIACIAILGVTHLFQVAVGPESIGLQLAEARTRVGYLVAAVFVYGFIRSPLQIRRMVRILTVVAVVPALVGLAQAMARPVLPDWLLVARGEDQFSYIGTEILRANGLIANTIVFGAVMFCFFCLTLAEFLVRGSMSRLLLASLFAAAILASYSRMAIASAVLALVLIIVLSIARGIDRQRAALIAFGSALLAGIMLLAFATSGALGRFVETSFFVNGLFDGSNVSARGSSASHAAQIQWALEDFRSNPIAGVGLATQRSDSIWASAHPTISDGAIWLVLAEGGLVLALPTLALLVTGSALVIRLVRSSSSLRWIGVAALAFFTIQIGFASWLNTGVFGKPTAVIGSILLGVVASLVRCAPRSSSPPGPQRAANSRLRHVPGQTKGRAGKRPEVLP